MLSVLAVIFILVPILEIAVIVLVADYLGGFETLALLIAVSFIGAVLAKREGVGVWRRFRATVSRGETPSAEITDGLLILFGGALLLTPGFVTDLLGLFLLAPVTRPLVKRVIRGRVAKWVGERGSGPLEQQARRRARRGVAVVETEQTHRSNGEEKGE